MNKFTDIFNWQRFLRVLANDVMLLQARRIGFASLGLAAIGIVVYLSNITELPEANQGLAVALFAALLIGGGQIFTSMIFNDMHHPLERFHYLMLPCSNLERFISRYLITAPLYLVYAIVLFKLFELVANFAIVVFFDYPPIPRLDLGSDAAQAVMLFYFATHVFVYAAAIWFRSYALIKLFATSTLMWTACGLLFFVALRIFYWDSFISLFRFNPDGPFVNLEWDFLALNPDGSLKGFQRVAIIAGLLWVLFLGYVGLDEHEVQDGL